MQEQFKVALQLAAEELAKTEEPGSLPQPEEVAQLVEEAMFGFYGGLRCLLARVQGVYSPFRVCGSSLTWPG